jgi:hypothetical protein
LLPGLFWYGGETSLNGVPNPKTKQTNSRIGATAAVPISKHQSLKISYNNGAYINYGGNYQNISLGLAVLLGWLGEMKFLNSGGPAGQLQAKRKNRKGGLC